MPDDPNSVRLRPRYGKKSLNIGTFLQVPLGYPSWSSAVLNPSHSKQLPEVSLCSVDEPGLEGVQGKLSGSSRTCPQLTFEGRFRIICCPVIRTAFGTEGLVPVSRTHSVESGSRGLTQAVAHQSACPPPPVKPRPSPRCVLALCCETSCVHLPPTTMASGTRWSGTELPP